ncbi:hypothetical protein Tco_0356329 [Tanacetum coccineum]
MQELPEQLQELQDKVSVGITEEGEVVTYLRFIANISKIFKPITSLAKRNQKYEWGAEREEAFQTLKNELCVKDKILATLSEMHKVENAPAEMLCDMDQQMEKRADDGKANVVTDALSRKERVKPRRVRAMAMTIQYGVRGMILAAQSEAFKQENVPLVGSEMDEAHASSYADSGRKMREYEVGENVLLKVSPWKGVMRFRKKGKLAPRYVGPFEILERIDPVAYLDTKIMPE